MIMGVTADAMASQFGLIAPMILRATITDVLADPRQVKAMSHLVPLSEFNQPEQTAYFGVELREWVNTEFRNAAISCRAGI